MSFTIGGETLIDNGEKIGFTIKGDDGQSLSVTGSMEEMGRAFRALLSLTSSAGEMRGKLPSPTSSQGLVFPAAAYGLLIFPGKEPDQTIISMRLFGLDVGFSVSQTKIVQCADKIAYAAKTNGSDSFDLHRVGKV